MLEHGPLDLEKAGPYRFSLVVATLGRSIEIEPLLRSLIGQQRSDFQVLVVDQNQDERLTPILERFSAELPIVHIRTALPGVCRARNLGAKQATGDWLMFPDDDCWYPRDFLSRLTALSHTVPADFYSGRPTDPAGETIMGRFSPDPGPITRGNVWTTLMEWLLVVRRQTFEAAGGFDERIGPGAKTPWGAHEVQDLVLKCLDTGAHGYYAPDLNAHHPVDGQVGVTMADSAKMFQYSAGFGYVMRRHGFSAVDFLPHLVRPMAGMLVYGLRGEWARARRSRSILLGRIRGWRTVPDRL